jgi:aryl-alcohol dehydrogenase-like predicted oxidoreductase
MVRRRLGRTGLAVSPIGLGTTKLGRNTDVKYAAPFRLPSDRQTEELLQSALDLGVNLIDTAPAYGESERRLGQIIATQRTRWVVCTIYDFSATALNRSVEASLRRLKTDYVDILLLHSDGRDLEILTRSDAVAVLTRLKASGKARFIGISAKTPQGIAAALPMLDVVMAPFSERDPGLADALAAAHAQDLGIIAIKGLFSGHLAPSPAIEFVLRHPFVDALILGTINKEHLREAAAVAARVGARNLEGRPT